MTQQRQIRFIVTARRWFDKINGNTYHSVRVLRVRDGKLIAAPFQYGYGEHYRQTALELMARNKWIPPKYRTDHRAWYAYERENNYPIYWTVTDGLKRDCVANGQLS